VEQTLQAIRSFVEEQFLFYRPESRLTDDESLLHGGVIDSVGVLSLIQFLEDRFGIAIDDDEVVPENLDSIARLTTFVTKKKMKAFAE
jgi:acyl carrier protein